MYLNAPEKGKLDFIENSLGEIELTLDFLSTDLERQVEVMDDADSCRGFCVNEDDNQTNDIRDLLEHLEKVQKRVDFAQIACQRIGDMF